MSRYAEESKGERGDLLVTVASLYYDRGESKHYAKSARTGDR